MMKVLKPLDNLDQIERRDWSVFLAGSIEMGTAEDWQDKVTNMLTHPNIDYVLNPRRDDWDSSWEQSIENKQFKQQVEWELDAMEKADKILMYFAPDTKSPISLLELGVYCGSSKLIVFCPDGFWRKGNVDVVCERYKTVQVSSFKELVERAPYVG